MRKSWRSRSASTSGSGSTVPAAVVPSVTTTVPISPAGQRLLQGLDIHPPAGVDGDLPERDAEDRREPRVRVMGLRRGGHRPARDAARARPRGPRSWPWSPRRRGGRGASSQPNIAGDPGHGLLLHRRGGPAAVEGVVVRVEEHRQRVGEPGDRMRRLEHLPDIERMMIRVVVLQSLRPSPSAPRGARPGPIRGGGIGQAVETLLQRSAGISPRMREALVVERHEWALLLRHLRYDPASSEFNTAIAPRSRVALGPIDGRSSEQPGTVLARGTSVCRPRGIVAADAVSSDSPRWGSTHTWRCGSKTTR